MAAATSRALLALLGAALLCACGHPAERALAGRWQGEGVENFPDAELAAATGWARGTTFEFSGRRITVAVPAEEPRTGTYQLERVEDRTVRLAVLGADGQRRELELIVDDEDNLRWALGDGRTLRLKRRP